MLINSIILESMGITKSEQLKKNAKPKHKTCKKCGEQFEPIRPFQKCCTYSCAIDYAKAKLEQKKNRENSKAKKEHQQMDRTFLLKIAQKTFNEYIRKRDGKICISCGYVGDGRKFDAGHYKSQGGNSALRFDENNCFAQCVQCNQFKSGSLASYRIALINKIGENEVNRLETSKNTKLWTVEELQEIIKTYKAKIKGLKCD